MSNYDEKSNEESPEDKLYSDTQSPEDKLGESRGALRDPLEPLQSEMEVYQANGFYRFHELDVLKRYESEAYRKQFALAYREWTEHMAQADRHETLPTTEDVEGYMTKCLETQSGSHVRTKLSYIRKAYQWFQRDPRFPHPTDYDPFAEVMDLHQQKLKQEEPDDFPPLTLEDVQRTVKNIKHVGERAATVVQLKTGVRSSELCNVRFEDITLSNRTVMNHYEDLNIGKSYFVHDVDNAVFIPPGEVRKPNKRECPTVIPLDEETRKVLIDYLLIRPDNGNPYVFLTKKGKPMDKGSLEYFWNQNWSEYRFEDDTEGDEEEEDYLFAPSYRSIVPHWSRHWMATWLRTEEDWNESWIQYVRGDKMGPTDVGTKRTAMHRYIHTHYHTIEDRYRKDIFQLGL